MYNQYMKLNTNQEVNKMKLVKGTEDKKVVTSELDITTHRVDELLVEFNPNFTEADRTYACLYQNHVSRIALDSELSKEERKAKKHETHMRIRQLISWESDVRVARKSNYVQIRTFLNELHGNSWNK
tara:strand:+ start:5233 stop:5613 length:381 start_codon:yes stop_codon:yes gene_type:complete